MWRVDTGTGAVCLVVDAISYIIEEELDMLKKQNSFGAARTQLGDHFILSARSTGKGPGVDAQSPTNFHFRFASCLSRFYEMKTTTLLQAMT